MTKEQRILKKFDKTPLRWHRSGKKVYTVWFRLRVFIKKIEYRLKFFYWLYLNK